MTCVYGPNFVANDNKIVSINEAKPDAENHGEYAQKKEKPVHLPPQQSNFNKQIFARAHNDTI